jgi:hypothetical protein
VYGRSAGFSGVMLRLGTPGVKVGRKQEIWKTGKLENWK